MIKMVLCGFLRVCAEPPKGPTAGMRSWNLTGTTAEYFSDRQLAGLAQHAKEQIDNDYIKKSPWEYPGICRPAIVTVVIVIGDSYIYCIVW